MPAQRSISVVSEYKDKIPAAHGKVEFLYDAATGGEGMSSFVRLSNGDRLNFAHTFSISFLGPSVSSGPSKA
jgi:hypothetical protein